MHHENNLLIMTDLKEHSLSSSMQMDVIVMFPNTKQFSRIFFHLFINSLCRF